MKPGVELDQLIAEKVMGLTEPMVSVATYGRGYPPYSTDISAAWEVFLASKEMNIISRDNDDPNSWIVGAYDPDRIIAKGESAPHAICLAALKAVGHSIE